MKSVLSRVPRYDSWCGIIMIIWNIKHTKCDYLRSAYKKQISPTLRGSSDRIKSVKLLSSSFQDPVKTVEETVARKGPEVPRNSEQKIITTAADLTAILPPPPPPIPPRPATRSPPLPPRLPSFTEYFSMQSGGGGGGGGFGTKAWDGEKKRQRAGLEWTEWQFKVKEESKRKFKVLLVEDIRGKKVWLDEEKVNPFFHL